MNKETIKVTYVGKFGPSVSGVWYNLDAKSGLKPDQFEAGKTYTVLTNLSKTGKKYIAQIVATEQLAEIGSGVVAPVLVNKTTGTEEAPVKFGDDKILEKKEVKKESKKDVDWDAVNRGKVACVQFEAALQSPGLAMYATSKDEYLKIVKEAAEMGIKFTWDNQRG